MRNLVSEFSAPVASQLAAPDPAADARITIDPTGAAPDDTPLVRFHSTIGGCWGDASAVLHGVYTTLWHHCLQLLSHTGSTAVVVTARIQNWPLLFDRCGTGSASAARSRWRASAAGSGSSRRTAARWPALPPPPSSPSAPSCRWGCRESRTAAHHIVFQIKNTCKTYHLVLAESLYPGSPTHPPCFAMHSVSWRGRVACASTMDTQTCGTGSG